MDQVQDIDATVAALIAERRQALSRVEQIDAQFKLYGVTTSEAPGGTTWGTGRDSVCAANSEQPKGAAPLVENLVIIGGQLEVLESGKPLFCRGGFIGGDAFPPFKVVTLSEAQSRLVQAWRDKDDAKAIRLAAALRYVGVPVIN